MNVSALKKFVEENQRLAAECSNLLAQFKRWEKECALYDHDREALMDFGNEADERAKEAEIRVHDLKEEVRKLSEELNFYKCQYEKQVVLATAVERDMFQDLLPGMMSTLTEALNLGQEATTLDALELLI